MITIRKRWKRTMQAYKKLLSDDTIKAYQLRFKKMQKLKFSKEGDEEFIEKIEATSEQISNLQVKTDVNDFEIINDEPKKLCGTGLYPRPIELFIGSVANCLEISALLYFSFSNLKVESVKVKVEAFIDKRSILKDVNAPLLGFYDFKYTFYIKSNEDKKKIQKVLKKVEKNCPVKGTLNRSNEFKNELVIC